VGEARGSEGAWPYTHKYISHLFSISVYGMIPKYAYHAPLAAMEFISDIFIATEKQQKKKKLK